MKKYLLLSLATLFAIVMSAAPKQVVIVSVNDMHSALDNFPKFAAVIDSLRAIYPQLLVFSAGDNRTGNPLNDLYSEPSYPMTVLMNAVGFNASAIGNHEFDSQIPGFCRQAGRSNFRYLCANFEAPSQMNIPMVPYQIFDVEGVSVGVVGVVQTGTLGTPDTHPDNVKGIKFRKADEALADYTWLSEKCDVSIVLSHNGYEDDIELAAKYPMFDVILGGHSHTRVEGTKLHSGVLITQAENKLKYATVTKITVDEGKVISKESELIDVLAFPKENKIVRLLVDHFCDNPEFTTPISKNMVKLENADIVGNMMADVFKKHIGAQTSILNFGGVRITELPVGDVTLSDVLSMEPFGNENVLYTLTGAELRQMIIDCIKGDENRPPYTSGMTYELVLDKNDSKVIKDVKITMADGTKCKPKQKYTVTVSTYTAAICTSPKQDEGKVVNIKGYEMLRKEFEANPEFTYTDFAPRMVVTKK